MGFCHEIFHLLNLNTYRLKETVLLVNESVSAQDKVS